MQYCNYSSLPVDAARNCHQVRPELLTISFNPFYIRIRQGEVLRKAYF